MRIGIVGPPRSGKTTLFNAVTRGKADVATYTGDQGKPNLGVARVPDGRLDKLAAIFKPRRKVHAEISYVDIPGAPEGSGNSRGIAGEYLNHLQGADALLVVARAFDDPSVSHVEYSIDHMRDVETMLLELSFADVEVLDRRLARLAEGSKGAQAPERQAIASETSLLERLRSALDAGAPVRDQTLSQDEARLLEGFQLLTAKPVIVMVNAGESQMAGAAEMEEQLASAFEAARVRTAVVCGLLEMELAQMEPPEEKEFRESLGLGESGLDRMIRLSHDVGDLITFFTGNANEVRAWTIPRETAAVQAAGKVHSDFERGFIRAEVVPFDELAACGSLAEARKRGVLRQEGKSYLVQDGDVVNVLFNV